MRLSSLFFTILAIVCVITEQNSRAGKSEPNDDCMDICDGMCKMCIMFCQFSSNDEKDFGVCVKNCAALRFSCRMFCEVDFEGESAEAKKHIASSSAALKQLYQSKLRKAREEQQERYDGCARYCNAIHIECDFQVCRMLKGNTAMCYSDCDDSTKNCYQQCRTL